jgi:hypothetical protein
MGSYISIFHSDNAVVVIVVLHHNALNGVLFWRFEAFLHHYNLLVSIDSFKR